ncbi:MAG: acyl-CoA dehydrogenase family protein [Gemmatimonadaceae bacterium]|nr:acyl-CoA dehydrogenase family protein [Gemmatimonadaceae bacterium]MCW5825764.1 acyl-CoA dehydrogenase family protein [Gemmatimonadaceae bacterium]
MSPDVATPRPALTLLSDDEQAFKSAVAEFVDGEVRPRLAQMEREAKLDPALIKAYFEMGLMGIQAPEAHGGAAGSVMMVTLAVEEISKADASSAIMVDVQNTLVAHPLLAAATPEQLAKWMPALCSGTVGAYALSEASSGSDAFGLQTRALKVAGGWKLNGRKLWITNGAEAGLFILFATVDPAKGYKGITAFIVEREMPGFSVGKKEDKLGIRASSTTELILEDVFVPDFNVLGPVGQGYKIAIETLNEGRIGIGAQMIGVAQGALDAAVTYVKERQQFGKPLADFQAVQFQLAQAATELEAARLMVYNAARLRDAGEDIAQAGAMAKLYSSQVAERVTSLCVELFGGYGYTKDYPVEKFYRDAKIGTIYEGTSNMQLATIAKGMLK